MTLTLQLLILGGMGLFQRRPQVSDPVNFYSSGLHKTVLVAGLGNIGQEYDLTRHNVGFLCLDEFAKQNNFDPWIEKKDLKCHFASNQLGDTRVILIKPTTLMNLSGEAVQAATNFYKVHPDQTVVVHDELDIDFGHIRLRIGGSAAGHNGIKSVIKHFGDTFGRVRIGIGPKSPEQIDSADFVLQKFNAGEQKQLPAMAREVSTVLSEFVYAGGQLPTDTRSFLL